MTDTLLHYLSTTGRLSSQEFGDAFQTLHDARRRMCPEGYQIPDATARRASMRLYGQLGFGDYDAEGMLWAQPPAVLLLPVPPGSGRQMLLVGARTADLINQLRAAAALRGVQVSVCSQHESNAYLLLPDRVTLKATGSPQEEFGLSALRQVAIDCGIKFCSDLVQAELFDFSATLIEYKASLQPHPKVLEDDWKQSWFDPQQMRWVDGPGDKHFCLTEFEFNVYRKQCYLWQDGQAYPVDKSWGRYIALHQAGRQELLFCRPQGLLAVPAAVPLPELPARAAALLSGCAPEQRLLLREGQPRWYNVYQASGLYLLFFNKLRAILGQQVVEVPSLPFA